MTCERCKILKAQLAELRLAFGLDDNTQQRVKIQASIGCTPAEAHLLFILWGAKGRAVSRGVIEDCLNPDRDYSGQGVVAVHVCKLNRRAGGPMIANVWGQGWKLTERGQQVVGRALEA